MRVISSKSRYEKTGKGFIEMSDWLMSIFAFAGGLLFWVITYIAAPIESKRKGKHVSGLPGVAFVLFLLGGLLSPIKWLAFTCLLDFSVTALPFYLLINRAKNKRS